VNSVPARAESGVAPSMLAFYETMLRIQEADRAIQRGLSAGELQFQYYPAGGQEAIPAGIAPHLGRNDYSVITYRCIHDIVAKGTPLREIMAEMYGKAAGTSKGKGGPMHLSDPHSGLMVTTGIVGGGLPIANGLALATQMLGSGRVTVVSFGDGATSTGAFHEALTLASVWKLPVVFVCQNNQYAEYTSIPEYTRLRSFARKAEGYDMPGVRVDGTDPLAVHAVAGEAIARARRGEGPTLIEAVCHRLQGHAFGSDESHMDKAALAEAKRTAPVIKFRARLLAEGVAGEGDLVALEKRVRTEVDAAIAFAREAPLPAAEELYTDVFQSAESIPERDTRGPARAVGTPVPPAGTRVLPYAAAIADALDVALGRDPRVVLFGEDIADPAGGVLKATAGLSTKYGRERVRPTPIAETAIVGAAIGAALGGLRPIAEIMINDFLEVCMDQVANHAAKLRYMSGGRTAVPMVIRTTTAGFVGSFGAQHSQSLEGWLAHTPGLKIVYPSTGYEAKGLLLASLEEQDPVVFFEPVRCYFTPGPVPEGHYTIPLGTADIKRPGKDVTLVTYGWTVPESLMAAESLAKEGIDVEVLDLRSLVPLDRPAILESVGRTGRAVIVHSAVEFGGLGAELATMIHQQLHGLLKAPVARVGARYTPVPFSQALESLHFPTEARIAAAVRALVQ
jgi:pyruvate/2-oxoglutarate/acetoin dehydrogenase E1 component/TPP-dependent pyruvate/acetoin dehydrogenase alpha subunit